MPPDTSLLLDNQLCFALYAASRMVIHQYGPMLTEMDLTYTQYITLLVLWEKHPLPIKDLGQALLLDTGTLTPLLKKMETKGLVTRKRSAEDERIVMVDITPAGEKLKSIAQKRIPSLYCDVNIDPAGMIELRENLKTLISNIRKDCPPMDIDADL
jgi:MarR family transcriptional regulator, organic hydroperoxide resistance regulator